MFRSRFVAGVVAGPLVVFGALVCASESHGAGGNTSIVLGQSIGGVSLGTSQAALERFLGYRGEHSPTRTSDRKGAVDETYGYLRVTFVPCSEGRCVAAVATSSPAFRTPQGVHVQSQLATLLHAYRARSCGSLRASSDVSQPDAFCKLGFTGRSSGTTFLTVKAVISHKREVKTIAVAQAGTRWNIDPAAGIDGPTRLGGSSTRTALIVAAILLLILVPIGRLVWRFKRGDQLDPGGSDGRQIFRGSKRHKRGKHM